MELRQKFDTIGKFSKEISFRKALNGEFPSGIVVMRCKTWLAQIDARTAYIDDTPKLC